MRRILPRTTRPHMLTVLLLAFAMLLFATSAFAADAAQGAATGDNPTSAELVSQSQEWDGREITFRGEAITEAQERGDFSWIHINDDAYYLKNVEEGAALGGYNSGHAVWLPTELTRKIENYGDYTHEGDVVSVRGVFNAACGQHGGDMDIHATALVVEIPGHRFREPVHPFKSVVAIVIAILAAGAWLLNRKAQRRETFTKRSPARL